jgi:hypothetical protein
MESSGWTRLVKSLNSRSGNTRWTRKLPAVIEVSGGEIDAGEDLVAVGDEIETIDDDVV